MPGSKVCLPQTTRVPGLVGLRKTCADGRCGFNQGSPQAATGKGGCKSLWILLAKQPFFAINSICQSVQMDVAERFVLEVCVDSIKPPLLPRIERLMLPAADGSIRAIIRADSSFITAPGATTVG